MKFFKSFRDKHPSAEGKSIITRHKSKSKYRWALRVAGGVVALAILAGGVLAAMAVLSLNKVIQNRDGMMAIGLSGELELSKLKGEGEGRVNILLLGTSDEGHAGQDLSDTMIVASIDPKSYDVAMLGIPRDLYVKIPGYGFNKINTAHAFGEQQKLGDGPALAVKTVSELIDQPIHYFARVDFSGLRSAVDAIGGIDIYNAYDLYDSEYPCDRNESLSCGFKLKSGYYHMDGPLALKYARCRKGNCGDDYGRAKRQQSVVVALRDQALRLGNILNPAKASELVSIAGGHLRTDIGLEEMKRLIELGGKINSNEITSRVLDAQDEGLVKNSIIGGESVVIPTAGIGNYKAIRSFVSSLFIDGYVKSESAKVEIRTGSAKPSTSYALAVILKSLGYNVVKVSSIMEGGGSATKLIDNVNKGKPYTLKYLENRLKTSSQKADNTAASQADITIILGDDYELQNSN